jgi:hypothetical protein
MLRISNGVAFLLPFGDENFFSHVNFDGPLIPDRPELGPCWLWTGALSDWLYGIYRFPGAGKNGFSHRYAYAQTYGEITSEELVCHHCDRPACVNPAHLWLGTNLMNARDKIAKGRQGTWKAQSGDEHWSRRRNLIMKNGERRPPPSAKLTEDQVRSIRQSYAAGGVTHADLATEYGVKRVTITDIILHRKWKNVV